MDLETPENLRDAVLLVLGIWLLPVAAFGEVSKKEEVQEIKWYSKAQWNLTEHRPQRGVFDLP